MGYELKLIIGKTSSVTWTKLPTGTETWFQDMARLNLCKIGAGALSHLVTATQKGSKCPKHTLYFYSDDGNTQITEDKYGAPFKAVPVKRVLDAIKIDQKKDKYRRFTWAIALLKSMVKDPDGLEVIFFGY